MKQCPVHWQHALLGRSPLCRNKLRRVRHRSCKDIINHLQMIGGGVLDARVAVRLQEETARKAVVVGTTRRPHLHQHPLLLQHRQLHPGRRCRQEQLRLCCQARLQQEEARPNFALAAAVFRAQQVEAAGLEAIRSTGQIPRGPPDLPTGTEVIEQKCVAYLIGKGGQALAAINAAAGVSIQIDQSTKSFGWSMANIYGTEEGAAKAIRFCFFFILSHT
eukprot:g26230.t1